VLAGEGRSEVVGAEYVYCFRAVGVLHGSERQFFPRSEVPVPVPDSVTRQDRPAAFDTLQHSVKHLGQLMENLCDVADELCANFGDGLRDQAAAAWA
jgi:hypothetical protein